MIGTTPSGTSSAPIAKSEQQEQVQQTQEAQAKAEPKPGSARHVGEEAALSQMSGASPRSAFQSRNRTLNKELWTSNSPAAGYAADIEPSVGQGVRQPSHSRRPGWRSIGGDCQSDARTEPHLSTLIQKFARSPNGLCNRLAQLFEAEGFAQHEEFRLRAAG